MRTPDLKPREMFLEIAYVNKILGTRFSQKEVENLLEKMRFGVKKGKDKKLKVLIPAYRADIISEIDLVEDIAISYGYDKFKPKALELSTYGISDEFEDFLEKVRELALGFGFQEVMTLILTNEENLFQRMNLPKGKVTRAEKAVSREHSIARSWLLPSLIQVLEHNKNREYPQKIFEIGDCVNGEGKDLKKFSGVIAHAKTNFSEIKALVTGMMENLGLFYELKEENHNSFISGRCGSLEFGFFGEIHPQVLENFHLETPLTGFELNLDKIWNLRKD